MLLQQGLELAGQLAPALEHQLGFDPVLGRGQPRLLQPGDDRAGESGVGELPQRPPSPQPQRLAQQPHRLGRVLVLPGRAPGCGQLVKPGRIHGARREPEEVSAGLGDDAVAAQHLAKTRDMDLKTVAIGESRARPYLIQQLVGRDRLALRQGQRDQQGLRQVPADVHQLAVVTGQLERYEDPEFHCLHAGDADSGLTVRPQPARRRSRHDRTWCSASGDAGGHGLAGMGRRGRGRRPAPGRAADATVAGRPRRERQQVQIVRLVVAGDTVRASGLIAEHLAEFPADQLIGSMRGRV
jgi:hypothetical protein